jgi:eukaryotic-like serine/threonine-protein kinase
MLGRYALYEKIASGGMASVHIGRLLGPVGFARTVAIKRMHPQFAEDPEFVSMFLDEARLAARIRHPHVVPTLDVVATDGELFLVMDFVKGESLARLIRSAVIRGERIPPEMVAAMMVGALHGLHAAHEATSDRGEPLHIVHRDVSPHNILVGTDGVARMIDFGVAKAAGRLQTTREGQLKGKLAYMAPEQVRGEVTRATDVYSASVVLWEALTGKRFIQGDNEAQVLDRLLRGSHVPPSQYARSLPPALDEVTMRGLALDPAGRFSTAREMARALEHAIPLATASTIGEWVEAAAKETLDERSARIATIESESSGKDVPLPAPPASTSGPFRAVPVEGALAATESSALTQFSSGSVSSPARPSVRRGLRRTVWLAAGVGGLLAIAVLWVAFSRTSIPASPAANVIPSSPVVLPPVASSSASAVASDVPSASASSPVAASTAARPPSAPAQRRTGRPGQSVPASPAPLPSPTPKPVYNPLEHL